MAAREMAAIESRPLDERWHSVADISKHVDKAHETKDFADLADAPVDALQGLSAKDAEALKQAFNVKTIRDLAENKFVRRAQAIVHLAEAK